MRRMIMVALAACAALALLGCGSTDGEGLVADDVGEATAASGDGSTDDGSAVAAADADSAISEDGDGRPAEESDAATVVVVIVDVPDDVELAGVAVVALEDVTYADTESEQIASVEVPAAQLRDQQNRVELFLPLPLDGSVDVTATVHIDVDENGTISQGDWISPELAMIAPGAASEVTVTVVQV